MWAQRIRGFLQIPQDFGVGFAPQEWSKPADHTGPSGDTPLKEALIDKTQSGLFALYSGVLIWAAARLEHQTDVSALEDLAVALFCLQQDNSYYLPPAKRATILQIERQERYAATVLYLQHKFFQDRLFTGGRWPLYPTFSDVAQVIHLARYHMDTPQRALFDPWIEGAIRRMDNLAPFPDHANLRIEIPENEQDAQREATMGRPVPPQALDLARPLEERDLAAAWTEFLTTVDWSRNRFLRPPESVSPARGRAYREPR